MSGPIVPRKTPRQARARATVEAILEAAARILVAEGLERLTTNRVAEVAGISIGTLYQYFPSKEAILAEILRAKRQQLLEDIRAATAEGTGQGFEARLSGLIEAAIVHQLGQPTLARSLEYLDSLLPLEAETQALKAAILERVSGFLARGGIARPEESARDLVAALRGMIDAAGLAGETDREALFRRAMRLVRGYLGLEGSGFALDRDASGAELSGDEPGGILPPGPP
ncbi:TetR/AcrR family transcriptional regulator [Pararhodobacter aggregans]|nr:TetR/AcrR family transcriptional regulator [Pararhodobacter aggregans]PTX01907.1 TetR family transcriptional regulator [Pararhodobacter aggregans]